MGGPTARNTSTIYIRVTEFKHRTGQDHPGTSIVRGSREVSAILTTRSLAAREKCVTFVGRLAQYRYYNMDQVVGAALKAAREILRASSV